MFVRRVGVGVVIVVSVCIVSLCTACRKASQEVMERAIESQMAREGHDADVNLSSGGLSMKIRSKGGDSSLAFGKQAKLPDEFPSDVPLYPNLTLVMVQSEQKQQTFTIQGTTSAALDQVSEFYQNKLVEQGWEEESVAEQPGVMFTLSYSKENRSVHVILTAEDKGTAVMLNTGSN